MLDIASLFFGNRFDIPGHIGFLLMAVSLFLTNILWLRVFLVLSFAFLILYYALSPVPLYTGIAWSTLFILINLYRLKSLVAARRLRRPGNRRRAAARQPVRARRGGAGRSGRLRRVARA